MILCLDIGNSHIYGGVFNKDKLLMHFRYPSTSACTSDQLGVFLKSVLRENDINITSVKQISVSSVVPPLDYSLHSAAVKYFNIEPFFLKAGIKTGLNITYNNPHEIGADRIANAIAAVDQFAGSNIIIIDLGTATTFDIISDQKNYLSALIIPGMRTAMKALHENTAKLPPVNIMKPVHVIGQTTITNIQSGLYYGHLGGIKEIIQQIISSLFQDCNNIMCIGTGGFAHLFEDEKIFNVILPDLILHGLRLALEKNQEK